jgi:hypothetical protein
VRVVKALLRFFSYLYHVLFALVMLVFGLVVTIAGGGDSLHVDMLPWSGPTTLIVLLIGGIFGLIVTILAIKGKLRPIFFLWALAVTYYLMKGLYFGSYRFTPDSFQNAGYLVAGCVLALLGAFVQMFRPSTR